MPPEEILLIVADSNNRRAIALAVAVIPQLGWKQTGSSPMRTRRK